MHRHLGKSSVGPDHLNPYLPAWFCSRMIPRSSTSRSRSLSESGAATSNNATATTSSTRWTSEDIPMSSSSPHRKLGEKKPFEPPASPSSRSVSLDEPGSDHEAPVLPPPVVATSTPYNRPKKTIRIDGGRGLGVHWTRFRRRLGAGTSPSTSSLVEDTAPSSSVDPKGGSQYDDYAEVDEVVVDRNWSDEIKSSVSLSEQDISLDGPGHYSAAGPSTDRDSDALHTTGFWGLSTPLVILRWRLFPAIVEFFSPKFLNEKSELHYVKENWFMHKVRRITSHISYSNPMVHVSPLPIAITAARYVVFSVPHRQLGG